MSDKNDFKQLMRNREDLYRFFARLFEKEIDEEFFEQLKHVVFPFEREETAMTELQDALLRLNEYFEYDAGETLDDIAADYAKTFLGAGDAQGEGAFPYESVYTSPKRIMMQDAWSQVCEIFRMKGVEPNENGEGIIEDHIAMELEYMAYLCDDTSQYTETLFGLEEQRNFLNNHLLNWVPEFCLDIKEKADTEFYRMVGQLTTGFLQFDSFVLDTMINERKAKPSLKQSFYVSRERLNEIVDELKKDYHIYAPKHFRERGMRETDGLIRYVEIESIDEIVNNEQSDFSPKEVLYPIAQTLFKFDENSVTETPDNDTKGIIIFARPCDIEGFKRLDNMFLANGGTADVYYKAVRDKTKFFMLECPTSWEGCRCVSMGTNRTDNYSVAINLGAQSGYSEAERQARREEGIDDGRDKDQVRQTIELQVKDAEFIEYFENEKESYYAPRFIEQNANELRIPHIDSSDMLKKVHELDMWKEVSEDCISCGGCNAVCISCSCYETVDFLNQENSRRGERRRIWSTCMMPEFSKTAGGHIDRPFADTMMRFKTLHKVYDYNARFGGNEHMCIGCGRCSKRCPQDISFYDTVNRLYDEVENIKKSQTEE